MKLLFMVVCIFLAIGAMLMVDARPFVKRYMHTLKNRNKVVFLVRTFGIILFISTLACLPLFKSTMMI